MHRCANDKESQNMQSQASWIDESGGILPCSLASPFMLMLHICLCNIQCFYEVPSHKQPNTRHAILERKAVAAYRNINLVITFIKADQNFTIIMVRTRWIHHSGFKFKSLVLNRRKEGNVGS